MAIDKTEMMKIVQDKLTGVDNEQDTKKKPWKAVVQKSLLRIIGCKFASGVVLCSLVPRPHPLTRVESGHETMSFGT